MNKCYTCARDAATKVTNGLYIVKCAECKEYEGFKKVNKNKSINLKK